MNLLDLIQSKIELFRLEQRYTRRRNRRSAFVSEAQYVDGEYIYSPTSSYSAQCTAGSDSESNVESKEKLGRSNRLSKVGIGSMEWRKGGADRASKRQSRMSVRDIQWGGDVKT